MDYLQRALELADRAVGRTSPNPAVGAVLVNAGEIVGEGFTQPPGSAHAEVVAIVEAGERARGAELYVTLEPCSHWGRTPPCTDAILTAGIRAVHIATLDPFPAVNGRGLRILRDAGIEVWVGEHEAEARQLNAAFLHFVQTGRPFVTAKWAMTLDGKIAASGGDSRWVTGPEARALVHRERDASDAIVVGVQTVIADDPQLTVRLEPEADVRAPRAASPLRVILDSTGRTPATARLVSPELAGGTLVLVTDQAPSERVDRLSQHGVEVARSPSRDGRIDLTAALGILAARGVRRVLLESGGELTGAFFHDQLVDRVLAFVALKVIGGRDAATPVGGVGWPRMADAISLADLRVQVVGADLLIEGTPIWTESNRGGPEESENRARITLA